MFCFRAHVGCNFSFKNNNPNEPTTVQFSVCVYNKYSICEQFFLNQHFLFYNNFRSHHVSVNNDSVSHLKHPPPKLYIYVMRSEKSYAKSQSRKNMILRFLRHLTKERPRSILKKICLKSSILCQGMSFQRSKLQKASFEKKGFIVFLSQRRCIEYNFCSGSSLERELKIFLIVSSKFILIFLNSYKILLNFLNLSSNCSSVFHTSINFSEIIFFGNFLE